MEEEEEENGLQERIDSLTLQIASLTSLVDSLKAHNDSLTTKEEKCQQIILEMKSSKDEEEKYLRNSTKETPPKWFQYNPPRRKLLPCPRGSGQMVTVTKVEGGFADRIKGMVNAYIVALLSGRGLYFVESLLADNTKTIAPSACDWTDPVPTPHDAWRIKEINVRTRIFSDANFNRQRSKSVWDIHSNLPFGDEVIQNPQFRDSPLQPELMRSHEEGKLFHQAMRSLLKPSVTMETVIQRELESRNPGGEHYLIGIHLRAGDNKIAFKRSSLDRDHQYRRTHPHAYRMVPDGAFPCFVHEAATMWQELSTEEQARYPKGPLFFVSGDYETGGNRIKQGLNKLGYEAFDASHLAGEVRHIVAGGDQSRTFVDWWLLTRCQKLVISVSGYSETAAKYDCVPVSFFVNHPTLKLHNDFALGNCVHHFVRMRGDGLCVPEMDDNPLFEYTYYRYK